MLYFKVVFYWTLVARHISRCINKNPHLKPQTLPIIQATSQAQMALSKTHESQIREIFELFDTDGDGTIDQNEMDFALVALGFQSARKKSGQGQQRSGTVTVGSTINLLDAITADGHVTLEEFVKLMTGHDASGSDPWHSVAAVFAVLSRSSFGVGVNDNLITFDKLQTVCRDFQV
jgi:Ca2+-binding EF-hand superfamily protein